MTQDDLKKYSVVVEEGSGCIFQPMTVDYTYVLTANHLFYDITNNEQGEKVRTQKLNGSEITIRKNVHQGDAWIFESIPFVLNYDENYFPHENADLAILKIPYQEGFNMITVQEDFEDDQGFALCGFPSNMRDNEPGDWYRNNVINGFGASGNYAKAAQLVGNLNQRDIEGMSGCGILKLHQEGISIIGTQSKMASIQYPAGGIGFVPTKYAFEIIKYEKNIGKLEKLYPNTLSNFSFLKNKAFFLEVDAMDSQNAEDARQTLLNKAQNIIDSNITPYGIKELFKKRLLITEKDDFCLSFNTVWIAWLEFLTIMNIVKEENINSEDLSDIFNTYRLKYVNIEDWTANVKEEYGKSDYYGMQPNSTVIISSKNPAKTKFKIPKGTLIDIGRPYDKSGFRTDKGLDPFTSFNFVHIDYFKTKCIVNKIEEYKNLNEEEIIAKLKNEYNDLFQ